MWYLLADQMKDGGCGLIGGSNWSSCVISTSLTLASGPSLPGGFQSVWSRCLCLSSQAALPFFSDWWSQSWWLLKSGARKARITPLANTALTFRWKKKKKRWMRSLLTHDPICSSRSVCLSLCLFWLVGSKILTAPSEDHCRPPQVYSVHPREFHLKNLSECEISCSKRTDQIHVDSISGVLLMALSIKTTPWAVRFVIVSCICFCFDPLLKIQRSKEVTSYLQKRVNVIETGQCKQHGGPRTLL